MTDPDWRMQALRERIDALDERIVALLNERAACALEIGEIKRTVGMAIYQPGREKAVLEHVRQVNAGPLDGDAVMRLFERIIDEARRLERVVQQAHDAKTSE
ncbi:chorismate mutase [Luteitalea sp.]|jgi:chorismate mutase|uniref:chorismate mutase n=1 Tax=Luteitalea sp. TaxID=2004800 RepID=UPI0025BB8B3C|nr:chorismate mutase [Luteitalea sp.]